MSKMMICAVCGGSQFNHTPVLWQGLIDEWQLSPFEADYVDRQQGTSCVTCHSNLRSVALARALQRAFGTSLALDAFVSSSGAPVLKVLEVNEAGTLHAILRQMKGHVLATYPDIDMHALPYPDETFDVVIHSDTLEHIPNPIHALKECRRVLKQGGFLCYTVPTIVGRLTRGRAGLSSSFHGDPNISKSDYMVHTEFGADAWTFAMDAGFSDVQILSADYPAALALMACK